MVLFNQLFNRYSFYSEGRRETCSLSIRIKAFDHEWTQQYSPSLYLTVNGHFVCYSETIIIRSESNFQCFIYKCYVFLCAFSVSCSRKFRIFLYFFPQILIGSTC